MYLPTHFREERPEVLHALMADSPLATLVTLANGEPTADHIPFLLDAAAGPLGTLRGHVARANPLWRQHPAGREVLAIFAGPQAYITPSWYPSKAEHGRVVPTWNYVVAHARGQLRVIDDAAWLRRLVGDLTTRHESAMPAPWQVGDAPEDFIAMQLKAIVGIEIHITQLIGKWKTSQNRSAGDRAGVAAGLAGSADEQPSAMARLVGATSNKE